MTEDKDDNVQSLCLRSVKWREKKQQILEHYELTQECGRKEYVIEKGRLFSCCSIPIKTSFKKNNHFLSVEKLSLNTSTCHAINKEILFNLITILVSLGFINIYFFHNLL